MRGKSGRWTTPRWTTTTKSSGLRKGDWSDLKQNHHRGPGKGFGSVRGFRNIRELPGPLLEGVEVLEPRPATGRNVQGGGNI